MCILIMMVPFLNAPNPPLPSSHRGAITSVYRLQTFNHYLPIEVCDKLPGTLNIFRLSHKTQHIESQAAQIVEHQYYVIYKSYDKLHGITSTRSKTVLSSLSCLPCQGTAKPLGLDRADTTGLVIVKAVRSTALRSTCII